MKIGSILVRQGPYRCRIAASDRLFELPDIGRSLFGERGQNIPRRTGIVPRIGRQGVEIRPRRRNRRFIPSRSRPAAGRTHHCDQFAVSKRVCGGTPQIRGP